MLNNSDSVQLNQFKNGYALIIGVGGYGQSELSVVQTKNDAEEIAAALQDPRACAYPQEHVSLLTSSEETTKAKIFARLNSLPAEIHRLNQKNKEKIDTLILFYAGHGYVAHGTYYILAQDSKSDINSLISMKEFRDNLDFITLSNEGIDNILIIINACKPPDADMPDGEVADDPALDVTQLNTGVSQMNICLITACQPGQESALAEKAALTYFGQALASALRGYWPMRLNKFGDPIHTHGLCYALQEEVSLRTKGGQLPEFQFKPASNPQPFAIGLFRGARASVESELSEPSRPELLERHRELKLATPSRQKSPAPGRQRSAPARSTQRIQLARALERHLDCHCSDMKEQLRSIDSMIAKVVPTGGYLFLAAAPGTGKSALLAHWMLHHVKEHPATMLFKRVQRAAKSWFGIVNSQPSPNKVALSRVPHYFIPDGSRRAPECALSALGESLLEQIESLIPRTAKLDRRGGEKYDARIKQAATWALKKLNPEYPKVETPLVVIIDNLSNASPLAYVDDLTGILPSERVNGLVFVVSYRSVNTIEKWRSGFRQVADALPDLRELLDDFSDAACTTLLRSAVSARKPPLAEAVQPWLLKKLGKLAAGNIQQAEVLASNLLDLPLEDRLDAKRLLEVCETWLLPLSNDFIRKDVLRYARQFLAWLALQKSPLTWRALNQLRNISKQAVNDERGADLDGWHLVQYLLKSEGESSEPRFRLFHPMLIRLVLAKLQEWKELGDTSLVVEDLHRAFSADIARWPADSTDESERAYALRHAAEHLAGAGSWTDVLKLYTQTNYLSEQLKQAASESAAASHAGASPSWLYESLAAEQKLHGGLLSELDPEDEHEHFTSFTHHQRPEDQLRALAHLCPAGGLQEDLLALSRALDSIIHLIRAAPEQLYPQLLGALHNQRPSRAHLLAAWPCPENSLQPRLRHPVAVPDLSDFTFNEHKARVNTIAVFADGKHAVSGDEDGFMFAWSLKHRCKIASAVLAGRAIISSVAIDQLQSVLILCAAKLCNEDEDSSTDNVQLFRWRLKPASGDPELAPLLQGAMGGIRLSALAVASDSHTLAVGAEDGSVFLCDLAQQRLARKLLLLHPARVAACIFSPDGAQLITASTDGTLLMTEVRSGKVSPIRPQQHPGLRSAVLSPDGSRIISAHEDGTLLVTCCRDGRILSANQAQAVCCAVMQFPVQLGGAEPEASQGNLLGLSASLMQTLQVWHVGPTVPEAALLSLSGHGSRITALSAVPQGHYALSGDGEGRIKAWDLRRWLSRAAKSFMPSRDGEDWERVLRLAVSSNGSYAAVTYSTGKVKVVDLTTGADEILMQPNPGNILTSCAITHDGSWVSAVGSDINMLWHRDGESLWHAVSSAAVKATNYTACAFSSDTRWYAIGDDDGCVLVWDLQVPQATPVSISILAPYTRIDKTAFVGNRNWLAVQGADSSFVIIDLADFSQPRSAQVREIYRPSKYVHDFSIEQDTTGSFTVFLLKPGNEIELVSLSEDGNPHSLRLAQVLRMASEDMRISTIFSSAQNCIFLAYHTAHSVALWRINKTSALEPVFQFTPAFQLTMEQSVTDSQVSENRILVGDGVGNCWILDLL